MAFCTHCGTPLEEGAAFCPHCGAKTVPSQQANTNTAYTNPAPNTAPPSYAANTSGPIDPRDIADNKGMAFLAYLGVLFFIPLVARPESKYCRFHANQGLVLLLLDIAIYIVAAILSSLFLMISWRMYWLSSLLYLAASGIVLTFSIMGIVNAATGKAKRLPIIGNINIIK